MGFVIGSVPYLNARPLIRWFGTDEGRESGVQVIEDTPARLAVKLEAGEIDAALVSVFAAFQHPEYEILPGVSISGQDEIRSVRAFSRLPYRMLHSVAMDTSSLTSVALLKVLLAEIYDCFPQAVAHEPDLEQMLAVADAALLIGDPGMLADGRDLRVLDLGAAWRKRFALPFTYAVWLARSETPKGELAPLLEAARDYGMLHANDIARDEAARLGCAFEVCYEYITEVMDYDLGEQHYEAIAVFHKKCREYALLSR